MNAKVRYPAVTSFKSVQINLYCFINISSQDLWEFRDYWSLDQFYDLSSAIFISNLSKVYFILKLRGIFVFLSGLAKLKRNPGENLGMCLIPLKSIMIFKQVKRTVELSIRTGSQCRSESASMNSTVRGYLYPINRTPTDDPIYGEGVDKVRVDT